MVYTPSGSGAISADAIELLQDLGYEILTDGLVTFDKKEMFKNLFLDKCLLYVRGKTSINGGHAWIIDGGKCSGDPAHLDDNSEVFLHCNWGWDGKNNGSYNADVLACPSGYPLASQYAPIRLSDKLINSK